MGRASSSCCCCCHGWWCSPSWSWCWTSACRSVGPPLPTSCRLLLALTDSLTGPGPAVAAYHVVAAAVPWLFLQRRRLEEELETKECQLRDMATKARLYAEWREEENAHLVEDEKRRRCHTTPASRP